VACPRNAVSKLRDGASWQAYLLPQNEKMHIAMSISINSTPIMKSIHRQQRFDRISQHVVQLGHEHSDICPGVEQKTDKLHRGPKCLRLYVFTALQLAKDTL